MMYAVLAPLLSVAYTYCTFKIDRERFLLYREMYPVGVLERQARMMTDPSEHILTHIVLNALIMRSILDFAVDIGMSLSFCYRLKRVVEVRMSQRRRHLYPRRHTRFHATPQKPVRWFMAVPFAAFSVCILVFTHESVKSSNSACAPFAECVAHVHRFDTGGLCPCIALVDANRAPTSYSDWMNPVDATEKVKVLAASGDLEILQLTNRRLDLVPEELQRCKKLRHMYEFPLGSVFPVRVFYQN